MPILEAPYQAGVDHVDCGLRGVVKDWSFNQVGMAGGQTLIVIGSPPRAAAQEFWITVLAEPGTGKITRIACAIGGDQVTRVGAKDAATSFYLTYVTARQRGAPQRDVIARLLQSGPTSGNSYLQQVQYAVSRHEVRYDPVLCTAAGDCRGRIGRPGRRDSRPPPAAGGSDRARRQGLDRSRHCLPSALSLNSACKCRCSFSGPVVASGYGRRKSFARW